MFWRGGEHVQYYGNYIPVLGINPHFGNRNVLVGNERAKLQAIAVFCHPISLEFTHPRDGGEHLAPGLTPAAAAAAASHGF